MASLQLEVFAVYHLSTNVPLTGQAGLMSFLTYKDDLGADVTPPDISEIGGGLYGFTPSFPEDTSRGVGYVIDTGTNANPTRVSRYVRPEDYVGEYIRDFLQGKWTIVSTGEDANRLVVYAEDGVTILRKFELQDIDGEPTTINPFNRIPV